MSTRRRWLVPEVVQTSAMDCGPAVLAAGLAGFGIRARYDRLREACQTDVDGTSIDQIEQVARLLGLDAEQVMVPADHLFLPEAALLPALLVVRQPNGLTHFVLRLALPGATGAGHGPRRGAPLAVAPAVARRTVRPSALRTCRGLVRLGAVPRSAPASGQPPCLSRSRSGCRGADRQGGADARLAGAGPTGRRNSFGGDADAGWRRPLRSRSPQPAQLISRNDTRLSANHP